MTGSINHQIKSGMRRFVHGLGYEIHKLSPFPYTITSRKEHGEFPFWIADEMARLWYQEVPRNMDSEIGQLKRLIRPGDRVLEIGSHHGYMTVIMARIVGPSGFVCALEAAPENAMVAQAQVILNDLGRNAMVLHRAGSDVPGAVSFLHDERARNTNGQVSSVSRAGEEGLGVIQVAASTGDEIDSQYGPFDVLKLDVEGYEGKVLKGCSGILERRPRLAIELHPMDLPKFDTTIAEILRLIDAERYAGSMILRSDCQEAPKFDADKLSGDEPINVFLTPHD